MNDGLTVVWVGGRFDGMVEPLVDEGDYLPGFGCWRCLRDESGRPWRYESCGPWSGGERIVVYWVGLPCWYVARLAAQIEGDGDDGYDGWLAPEDRHREGTA